MPNFLRSPVVDRFNDLLYDIFPELIYLVVGSLFNHNCDVDQLDPGEVGLSSLQHVQGTVLRL